MRRRDVHNLNLYLTEEDEANLLAIADRLNCFPPNRVWEKPSITTLATKIAKGEILVRRVGELRLDTHKRGNRTTVRKRRGKKADAE